MTEVGGHYKREASQTLAFHTFLAGVRVGARRSARVAPFMQALFGGALASAAGELNFVWATQFGGGVDIPFRRGGPSLRTQVDLPIYIDKGFDSTLNGLRLTVGVVFDRP